MTLELFLWSVAPLVVLGAFALLILLQRRQSHSSDETDSE